MKLTHAEIDTLTGRDLDAAVAEHVFSLDLHPEKWPTAEDNARDGRQPVGMVLFNRVPEYEGDGMDYVHFIPANGIFQRERPVLVTPYSSDIAAAFSVVEAMRILGDAVEIQSDWFQADQPDAKLWYVAFRESFVNSIEPSLPVAICRAALKAVLQENAPVIAAEPEAVM